MQRQRVRESREQRAETKCRGSRGREKDNPKASRGREKDSR